LTGGKKFYGSRMTSQEVILESLNFRFKTVFLGVPRPVVEAPLKNFFDWPLFYDFRDIWTALRGASSGERR
jgi:hypothetical protein